MRSRALLALGKGIANVRAYPPGIHALDYPEAFDNHAVLELMKHLAGGGPGS